MARPRSSPSPSSRTSERSLPAARVGAGLLDLDGVADALELDVEREAREARRWLVELGEVLADRDQRRAEIVELPPGQDRFGARDERGVGEVGRGLVVVEVE